MAIQVGKQVEGARTQSLFREVNERIAEFNERRMVNGEILCECASKECVDTIPLAEDEYESVRRVSTHFLIAPGHDLPYIERIVRRTDRYVVVEKYGEAGKATVARDPRRRSAG